VLSLFRATKSRFGPWWKRISEPLTRAEWLNIFAWNLTPSCRMTWALSKRVDLYNQQKLIILRKTKHMRHSRYNLLDPTICTCLLSSLSSALSLFPIFLSLCHCHICTFDWQSHKNVNTSKSCLFLNMQSHYYLVAQDGFKFCVKYRLTWQSLQIYN
jgi:hypothetical protein